MRPCGRTRWHQLLCAAAILLAAGAAAGGCNGPGQPTLRMGALPFPGLGFYAVADPERLGKHRYWSAFQFYDGEISRGIIYTQRAGFVDVAHIRDTADWTRYFAQHAESALLDRKGSLAVKGPDRTRVHMRFAYPAGWDQIADAPRRELVAELALRAGQEAAYALSTWHELITWYDYGILPLVSERHSAFTYDDVMSHVVGLYVAERALRDRERDYNAAMTVALSEVLEELGAASPAETHAAVVATRGWWWTRGRGLKRHLDVGLDTGEITPLVIGNFVVEAPEEPHLASASEEPEPFTLPRVRDVQWPGMDFSSFLTVEIDPRLRLYRRRLRRHLPGEPERIVPERDIPILMEVVRREMRAVYGPSVDSLEDGGSAVRAVDNPQKALR